ncbi:MAG: NADH-quinone oxidoreductase subunit A [Candidatus Micrarchaeota archaeon]|nr:NADH-quinone oxidoreductase subunit A [Candidatus Micrarchaeota archaeon]
MVDQYLQVLIFAVIAVLVPVSTLLFSKMVRPRSDKNDVKTLVYESAEESLGQKVEIMHEYLHYFVAFLAFEIIGVIVIIWSTFTRGVQGSSGLYMVLLLIFGLVFEALLLAISRSKVQ